MTAIWRSREELIQQVVILAKQGESRRAISRALEISRNTVRVLLEAHAVQRQTEQMAIAPRVRRVPRASKVDARRRYGKTPVDRFAGEREHLIPLPRHPYDTARVVYRLCSIDGFISWDGNAYAVPYDHVTDILPVRVTQREIFIYTADLHCVAHYELAPRGAGKKLDPHGVHPPPRRKIPVDLDQIRMAFDHVGEHAAEFFRLMSAAPTRIWGHQARQILRLRERYSTTDLDAALGHAKAFGAFDFSAVERILAARATPRALDEYVAEHTVRRIVETLGETRTAPRDLTEYDRLPGSPSPSGDAITTEKEMTLWSIEKEQETTIRYQPTTPYSKDSDDTCNSSD